MKLRSEQQFRTTIPNKKRFNFASASASGLCSGFSSSSGLGSSSSSGSGSGSGSGRLGRCHRLRLHLHQPPPPARRLARPASSFAPQLGQCTAPSDSGKAQADGTRSGQPASHFVGLFVRLPIDQATSTQQVGNQAGNHPGQSPSSSPAPPRGVGANSALWKFLWSYHYRKSLRHWTRY
eukprot:SAG11_NODE_2135_length_3772_cov_6.006534_2_plen_179_part_00